MPAHRQSQPHQPLIICDVDEVLLHFIWHFERFLGERGLVLNTVSYRLDGNILNQSTGAPLPAEETKPLIAELYDKIADDQRPVAGAFEALSTLTDQCELHFLTNFPDHLAARRRSLLASLGFDAPMTTNRGKKDRAIAELMADRSAPSFFIDDSALHLRSALALEHPPACIHFVADSRYASLAACNPVPGCKFLTRDWAIIKGYIEAAI